METYAARKGRLAAEVARAGGRIRLSKGTISNLFRYTARQDVARRIDLARFNHVLAVDPRARTVDVEGLATFESVVRATLPHGLVPLITPELKHITVGGAIVGIGIESNGFKHGFVHDGLREAEVLLADGQVVVCDPHNDHADLFHALPNSYGTLGYVLRAKMRLMPAAPYVRLHTARFDDLETFLDAMLAATRVPLVDFVEGLIYTKRFLLTTSSFQVDVPRVDDIYRRNVFYKLVEAQPDVHLATTDYLFRYDPEWFWNLPDTPLYRAFRRLAPLPLRNSGFYKRSIDWKHRQIERFRPGYDDGEEPLIQDWQVPWDRAGELIRLALGTVDLGERPWMITPIRTPASPPLYPITADTLYCNLGSYCQIAKVPEKGAFYATRFIDEACFGLGGLKMLYSSTFLPEPAFNAIYNGAAYARLKQKYDPWGRLPTLFQKCAAPLPAAPSSR